MRPGGGGGWWRHRTAVALAAAVLCVTAGCAVGFGPRGVADGDELGVENGYSHDDPLSVTAGDGLNETEREAVVARTMARVEVIRGLEFREPVPVELLGRAEYRNRSNRGSGSSDAYRAWNDQVWEGLLLVGEDRSAASALGTVFDSSVLGFYSPSRDRIVLVTDSETPTVDTRTLAHELVHALQDQHLRLSADATTRDGQLAADGLVEGDAALVERRYVDRCGNEWACLERPPGGQGERPADFDRGVYLAVYAPYAEGPSFVEALLARGRSGDWSAVNAAYDRFPASTEQILHPDAYPDDRPAAVAVPDRSGSAWRRFDLEQQADTVGEASVYAMFWANGQVDRSQSPYDYAHPLSSGWGGDSLVPYTNGSHGGYVWKLQFDTPADAREFREGHVRVLRSRGARSPSRNVFVVPEDDPFGDAFRITRHGDAVVVVNAPAVDDLAAVHG